jgi:prevent-host-death family protein
VQDSTPTTRTVTISDIEDTIVDLVDQVSRGETRIVVETGGVTIAALVSSEDLKRLARLDEQRAERKRVVAGMREPFRGVPPEEIERATAKAVSEVREEMRTEREAAAASQDSRWAHDPELAYPEESDMANQPPPTQTLPMSDVKSALSGLVDAVCRNETRVVIEKRGAPVAALVSVADLERLQQFDREWETTTRSLERLSEAFADVPVEELEAKIDEIIAAGRTRDLAERRSA